MFGVLGRVTANMQSQKAELEHKGQVRKTKLHLQRLSMLLKEHPRKAKALFPVSD